MLKAEIRNTFMLAMVARHTFCQGCITDLTKYENKQLYETVSAECHNTVSKHTTFKEWCINIWKHKQYL